jgi:hypothetical protein
MSRFLVFLLLLAAPSAQAGEPKPFGGNVSKWSGFAKHDFVVFAAKRQRLQHLLGHRGIGDIEDEDDTRTALKRVPLVDLALEVEFRRGLHLAGQDAADLLKVRARLDCSDHQNPGGRGRGDAG